VAHLGLKAVRATPRSLQARWEKAVRRYEGTGTGVYADFTMRDPQNWIVREEEFFPTIDVPFEDITVMIQHEYDSLLRAGYGDYMQLPPPEKRYNHEAAVIDFGPYADSL
jgi:putative licD1 protein